MTIDTPLQIDLRFQYLDDLRQLSDEELLADITRRTLMAARDIFGEKSSAMKFFESILSTGEPDPASFSDEHLTDGVKLIDVKYADRLGSFFAYEMKWLYHKDIESYRDEGLGSLWSELGHAGLTFDQSAKYHEAFDLS